MRSRTVRHTALLSWLPRNGKKNGKKHDTVDRPFFYALNVERDMKRDPELLRNIMLAAEKNPPGQKLYGGTLKILCENTHELAEHVQLLIDSQMIDGVVHRHAAPTLPNIVIRRLKARGHDFLQAMRDDTVWRKVKRNVMKPAASWTLELAIEYAKHLIREKLGVN